MLIGVDIGGTKCALTLGDMNGNVIQKERFLTTDVNETVNNIIKTAKKLSEGNKIDAVGVSCGGPLNEKTGVILSPPNLPGWDNIHIKKHLEEALNVPCGVRNDANACAMAEWYFGAGRGTENMVFMTFGTGLGAGLILNGRLYSGTNGNAGELGHIRLGAFGPSGYGKCGSFEGFCSGSGLKEIGRAFAREALQNGEKVYWTGDSIDDFEVKDMAEAARKGDKYALKAFELCGTKLGEGLATVVDLLNPEKIIIGSVYARCEDILAPFMNAVLEREALKASLNVCKVVPPELGEAIGDAAALAVAKEVYDGLRS
jgi:glucokinase